MSPYDQFVRGVHATLLVLAVAVVAFALRIEIDLHQAIKGWSSTADQTANIEGLLATDLASVTTDVHQAIGTLNTGMANLNVATAAQVTTLNKTQLEVYKLSANARDFLVHADLNVNGDSTHPGILSKAADSVDNLNALEVQLQAPARDLTASLEMLPPIMADLQKTGDQTVIISQNTADSSHEIDLTLHDVQAFAHRELSPIRGTWNVLKGILMEFAGPAAEVATAIK
jgi:hypothetical protein